MGKQTKADRIARILLNLIVKHGDTGKVLEAIVCPKKQ